MTILNNEELTMVTGGIGFFPTRRKRVYDPENIKTESEDDEPKDGGATGSW